MDMVLLLILLAGLAANPADLTNNGRVDGEDLSVLCQQWLGPNTLCDQKPAVTLTDFAVLAANWYQPNYRIDEIGGQWNIRRLVQPEGSIWRGNDGEAGTVAWGEWFPIGPLSDPNTWYKQEGHIVQYRDGIISRINPIPVCSPAAGPSARVSQGDVIWWEPATKQWFFYNNSNALIAYPENLIDANHVVASGDYKFAWRDREIETAICIYDGYKTGFIETPERCHGIRHDKSGVVWAQWGSHELFYYNGEIRQFTDHTAGNSNPRISGNHICWSYWTEDAKHGIRFYDMASQETTTIAAARDNGITHQTRRCIYNNQVVWYQYDPNVGRDNIFFYDGNDVRCLGEGASPTVSSSGIAWYAPGPWYLVDSNQCEIYYFDWRETHRLTDNAWCDYMPIIDHNSICWWENQRGDMSTNKGNICIAELR